MMTLTMLSLLTRPTAPPTVDEKVHNVYGGFDPCCERAPRLVEPGDFLSQHIDDSIRRTAGFEPAKERIRWEILPGLLFIGF